jgi:hypothetical protein
VVVAGDLLLERRDPLEVASIICLAAMRLLPARNRDPAPLLGLDVAHRLGQLQHDRGLYSRERPELAGGGL